MVKHFLLLTHYLSVYNNVFPGWGVLEELGDEAIALQNVKLEIYDPIMCSNTTANMTSDWNRQICAGRKIIDTTISFSF